MSDDERTAGPAKLRATLASINLTLCHTRELVGLAYQLSCEIDALDGPEAVLQAGGRIATLMHVSSQQLENAQVALRRVIETGKTASA